MSEQRTPGHRWEYSFVSLGNPAAEGVLEQTNALGKLGWELVLIEAGVWIFKRPAAEQEQEDALTALLEETVPIVAAAPTVPIGPERR